MKKLLPLIFATTFTLVLGLSKEVWAQAPGGISSNLTLWLNSGTGLSSSGGKVSKWNDQSGFAYDAYQYNVAKQPGLTSSNVLFNSNPTLDFDLVDDGMNTTASISSKPYSFFVVYNSTNTSTAGRRAVQGGNNWLIGPYKNVCRFYGGAFVDNNSRASTATPVITTAIADTNSTGNGLAYWNGGNVSTNPAGVTAPSSPSVIGLGTSGSANEPMGGSIAEVVAFSSKLSNLEKSKVESYLALKYGISLDQTVKAAYVSSTGANFWDTTANGIYSNNIFGIGRDNGSGLNMSNSQSVNTDRLVVSAGSALNNGTFLMFSDNGLSAGPVLTAGLPGGATHASQIIWNVSKTGVVGAVTLKVKSVLPNTILLLDNSNTGIFTAISPSSVVGDIVTFTGVSLNNLAKLKLGYKLPATSPGGVATNLKLWFKASNVVTTNGVISSWSDVSGTGNDAYQIVGTAPALSSNTLNGNPIVSMSGAGALAGQVTPTITSNRASGFIVTKGGSLANRGVFAIGSGTSDVTNNNSAVMFIAGNSANSVGTYRQGGLRGRYSNANALTDFHLFSSIFNATNNLFYNEGKAATNATFTQASFGVNNFSLGGWNVSGTVGSFSNADIAEVVLFDTDVSATQQQKIQSYLAVKYGFTIDQTTATNYLSSTGGIIWDATANGTYNNNIFGIGKDSISGLLQTQSVSINTNQLSIANPSALADTSYLMLSDNNASSTPAAVSGLPGGATLATPLAWNTSKIGVVGNVDITAITNRIGAILMVDSNSDGTFDKAYTSSTVGSANGIYTSVFPGVSLKNGAKLKIGYKCTQSFSSSISVTPQTTPSLTACGGPKTFVVRLSNIGAVPISNLIFKDSLPPNINYQMGTVSGTGVTFANSVIADNVVNFNIASIPSSSYVDVSFAAAANCAVSSTTSDITNTYSVEWDCGRIAPFKTNTYSILFPSVSISVGNANATANCLLPFVKPITVCNGGFGSLDSVSVSDIENDPTLIIKNFNIGTVYGAGTANARTVLHAADFVTVGNNDGKLDQNECIVVNDTLVVVGSNTPISGIIRADWGCYANTCTNGTTNNTLIVNTSINTSSTPPSLTRTLTTVGTDSFGNIYNRPITYKEVVKNTSAALATNVQIWPSLIGLKYIDVDSVWASRNGGTRYHPSYVTTTGSGFSGTPAQSIYSATSPASFVGQLQPNNARISLGDLLPGDSVIVTFVVRAAGPILRTNDNYHYRCGYESYCGQCYRYFDGPSISAATDANMSFGGCPAGTYNTCAAFFPQTVYNGRDAAPVAEPNAGSAIFLARLRGYGFTDSTATNKCAYFDGDSLRLLLSAGVMDLPFYADKSQFYIKVKCTDGVKWDGQLNRTFGRLSTWSMNPWYADHVVDSTAYDSTIRVYFKKSAMPAAALTKLNANVYNSYLAGGWQLAIGVINTCPGAAQKRVRMYRVYTIDTTSGEPAVEAGSDIFPANQTWNSICVGTCADGVSILKYAHTRTTFGAPDNDGDGEADASGTLDLNSIATNLITWTDTLQTKYKMVVNTTQVGGVPYMYIKSSINYSSIASATICNNFLLKTYPQVTLKRGTTTYTAVGTAQPLDTSNYFTVNLSLAGTGGLAGTGLPTSYQNGDTVEVVENIVYYYAHEGWGPITWSFLHVPYTALTANPSIPQRFLCDSVVCNFQTVDMNTAQSCSNIYSGPSCGDTTAFQFTTYAQTQSAACGSTFFPGEARNIMTPANFKMAVPVTGAWKVKSVYLNWGKKINGTSNCVNTLINNQLLPTSSYSVVGDTMYFDLKAIGQLYGYDVRVNELRSVFGLVFGVKYQPTSSDTGCVKDHAFPRSAFATITRFETVRPMDSSTFYNVPASTSQAGGGSLYLNWPSINRNDINLYTGNSASISNSVVVVPVNYTKGSSGVYGSDFMAIPNRPGIIVDSVKDDVTGLKVTTVPGSAIYQLGYLAANSNRNFKIYTHVNLCNTDSLFIYADRTPCSGYPASWAGYGCKSYAKSAYYRYVTFQGELQMVDSLYSTSKNMCDEDTVEFKIINSQTQTAYLVNPSFRLPLSMTMVAGHTQLKRGTGGWQTVSDPIYDPSTGYYNWTLPAADSLTPVITAPDNTMYLRVGVTTSCGFVSSSQIFSRINGNVACGAITSLFNTNPRPLDIIGAPTLSYFCNPKATVTAVTGCNSATSYDYRVALRISGGPTGSADSVKVFIPNNYLFFTYNSAATGSHNAPTAQPAVTYLPDNTAQLGWRTTPSVAAGDSIVFTFRYSEAAPTNKCDANPDRFSTISTFINSSVYCSTIGANCIVSIPNGVDTAFMRSAKAALAPSVAAARFVDRCASGCAGNHILYIAGNLVNSGSTDVAVGRKMYMEPIIDLDNSGTVNAGDYHCKTYVDSLGLAMGGSKPFNYVDSFLASSCPTCAGKAVMLRFSNAPASPPGASQCLCDTNKVTGPFAVDVALGIALSKFDLKAGKCVVDAYWQTLQEHHSRYLTLERSADGQHWSEVSTQKGAGNSSQNRDYNVQDISPLPGTSYYRLKMEDNEGAITYSATKSVSLGACIPDVISVMPNPVAINGMLTVHIQTVNAGTASLQLFDVVGRKLQVVDEQLTAGENNFIIPMNEIAAGIYNLHVVTENGTKVFKINVQ